jgi:hypothetical protein
MSSWRHRCYCLGPLNLPRSRRSRARSLSSAPPFPCSLPQGLNDKQLKALTMPFVKFKVEEATKGGPQVRRWGGGSFANGKAAGGGAWAKAFAAAAAGPRMAVSWSAWRPAWRWPVRRLIANATAHPSLATWTTHSQNHYRCTNPRTLSPPFNSLPFRCST